MSTPTLHSRRLGSRSRVVEGPAPGEFRLRVPRGDGLGCGPLVLAVPLTWFAVVSHALQAELFGALAAVMAAVFFALGIALLTRHDEIRARDGALHVRRRPWPWAAARTIPLGNLSAAAVAERFQVVARPPAETGYLMDSDDRRRHRRQLRASQNPPRTYDVVLITREAPVTEIDLITGLRDRALAEGVAEALRERLGLAASWGG